MNDPTHWTLAAMTALALSVVLSACGGAGRDPRPGVVTTATAIGVRGAGGYLKSDGDGDGDERSHAVGTDNQQELVAASHGSSLADREAVTAALDRYYAAATAVDGAEGCALLDSELASSLASSRSGHGPGGGPTCAASLARLFRAQRQHLLAEEARTMLVTGVHVSGDVAFATLGFRKMPEGELILKRESGGWKLDALFDSGLP